MTPKSITLCAALALAACASGKPYDDLPMGEKITFEQCRSGYIVSSEIVKNKTGTVGGAIDGALNALQRLEELNVKAIEGCAGKQGVNPRTVPGYR